MLRCVFTGCVATRPPLSSTWKLLGPGDHVDQLLVSHAGEQGHHGDLGVGSAHLLTGAQYRGLCTLEQEKHLGKQQILKLCLKAIF